MDPQGELTDPRPPAIAAVPAPLAAGATIDRFVIRALLGQGAMGAVYRAHDPKLGREVAIKVVRPDATDAAGGHARLLREAQAAAKLSHPNVVTVYEVGEAGGQVYIVMELVTGQTVRAWRAAVPRTWREIVAVYAGAARGLAAAHAAGVVHRDFKPDNVMVGSDGRARITDFGLAGAGDTSPDGGATTDAGASIVTRTTSGTLIGTPAYMAPEQLDRQPAGAAADQFAFAVALHESLYGVRPFAGTDLVELRRHIADAAIAPAPDGTDVPTWVRAIIVRALAEDPAARFPAMTDIAAALERDPAATRRRIAIGAGAAVVAAAVAGGLVFALASSKATAPDPCAGGAARLAGVWDAPQQAAVTAAFAPQSSKAYVVEVHRKLASQLGDRITRWSAMYRATCEATSVRHEQSPALLDQRMACLDRALGETRALIEVYSGPLEQTAIDRAPTAIAGLTPIDDCGDIDALSQQVPQPADPAARTQITALEATLDRAMALSRAGRWTELEPQLADAVAAATKLGWPPLEARAAELAGEVDGALGKKAEQEQAARTAIDAASRGRDDDDLIKAWSMLITVVGVDLHRPDEALTLRPAAESAVNHAGGSLSDRARIAHAIASVLLNNDRVEDAAAVLTPVLTEAEAVPDFDPRQMVSLANTDGLILRELGKYDAALARTRATVKLYADIYGPDHPFVAGATMNLANLMYRINGDYKGSRAELERALAIQDKALPPDHPDIGKTLTTLAMMVDVDGDHALAQAEIERALAIKEKQYGPDAPEVASTLFNYAQILDNQKRYADARTQQQRALDVLIKTNGGERGADVALAVLGLGDTYLYAKDFAPARREYARAVAIWTAAAPRDPRLVIARTDLGKALLGANKFREGRAELERAIALSRDIVGADNPGQADPLISLAEADLALGKRGDAGEHIQKALALLGTDGDADLIANAKTVLARVEQR